MLSDWLLAPVGGPIDSIGELILFLILFFIGMGLFFVLIIGFGLFSSSMGLIVAFRKNKKLGLLFAGLFLASIFLAANQNYVLLVVLGILSVFYSFYVLISWIVKRLKK